MKIWHRWSVCGLQTCVLFFEKSQNRGFRPNSIKRDCTLRARKRPQGGPKSIFLFFFKSPDHFLPKSVPAVFLAPKLDFLAQVEV